MFTKYPPTDESYETISPSADLLKRRRNLYNKEQAAAKKTPEHIKARKKGKDARKARKKNR